MSETPIDGFTAVVPAGGVGSRLWPLSRPDRPKFLLDLLGTGSTLIQATLDRLAPLAADAVVVTGAAHADAVLAQLPDLPSGNVLAEPSPRDSMAAIALAAAVIEHRHGPRVIGSFAADHVIREPERFRAAVRTAIGPARDGYLVTLGIAPTGPSTAFGYIELGDSLVEGVLHAKAFTEKPDASTAASMLRRGGYAWNAGMFVARTDVLLGALDALQPTIADGVRRIAQAWDTDARDGALATAWPSLPRIAIDHALAEPLAAQGRVAVVPADFDWHDVGDFDSLAALATPGSDGVTRVGCVGDVRTVGSDGVVAVGARRTIAVVGVDDVVVVETDDVVLVVSRDKAQLVKDAASGPSGIS